MLASRIREHFRIAKDWREAGHFETVRLKQVSADLRAAVLTGRLIAVSGPVGVGKTAAINRLKGRSSSCAVCRSNAIGSPCRH